MPALNDASYVAGCSDQPLEYRTIGGALADCARLHGDREALVWPSQGIRLSWAALQTEVKAVASGLLALGLEPGDRVGIWSPNRAEWVILQLATAKAGMILVNINPAYRSAELEYCLALVGCRALIHAERFKTSDYCAMMRQILPLAGTDNSRLPDLEWLVVISDDPPPGFLSFSSLAQLRTAESDTVLARLDKTLNPEQPINIQFTSGTTGSPKGAMLTHHNILNNALVSSRRMRLTAKDRLCLPVPLYHCFGMVLGILACMAQGACIVLPGEAFDAGVTLATIAAEKCTAVHGVPTMFIAELDHPDFARTDVSTLRTGIMSGAPCPIEVMRRVIGQMHMRDLTIGYGMTEVSPLAFQTMPDDGMAERAETVGRVHDFVEAKIVDPAGRVVPRGEQGEILFRGYSVMHGYWGDADRTAQAIDRDGWMWSGDLGILDDRGYLRITGRAKDMIIRGGENIYPREIEEFLHRHPDVQEAHVFGVGEGRVGEEVCAWIRPARPGMTAADVRDWCRGRISHFKIPAHIRFVEEFPMTVTGKVQKFTMRAIMAAELAGKKSVDATALDRAVCG